MTGRLRRISLGLCILGAASTLGCTAEDPPADPAGPPDARYVALGEIVELSPDRETITIHHEDIPDFRDRSGEVTGMSGMAMPFPAAPGLDLGGIEVGDRVRFEFEVRWDGPGVVRVVEIEELDETSTVPTGAADPD